MIKWENSDLTKDMMSTEAQLYDRSVERYAEVPLTEIPSNDEFVEIYGAFRSHLYEANLLLFKLDSMAEMKFKGQMQTSHFDKMRESLDKCAERLQWATERARKMSYFLKQLLEKKE